jgi:hypothetical protein
MKKLEFLGPCLTFIGCETPNSVFKYEVSSAFRNTDFSATTKVVTDSDINGFPQPMQRYLHFAGVVGKPLVKTARLKQIGLFKPSPSSGYKSIVAEEYYFPAQRAFYWYGSLDFAPLLKVHVRDKYAEGKGVIWAKLANLFTVAKGEGKEFNVSALIRYLNELVWFPSGFIDSAISFQAIDDTKAEVTITDSGMTTSATLHFNAAGEMTLFESNERYAMTDNGLEKAPWLVFMRTYKEFHGYKVPTEGEAVYKLKHGDLEYAQLMIVDVEFNRSDMYAEE